MPQATLVPAPIVATKKRRKTMTGVEKSECGKHTWNILCHFEQSTTEVWLSEVKMALEVTK